MPDYRLLVDWDNDGTYANANADVWPRTIEGTFRCKRGRNFASQRTGRSVAGSLEVQIDNRDGLLDPDNTGSPLNGLLSGGRRIRWQMNDGAGALETQWTGWLRDITQMDRHTGFDRVRLRAWGVISRLVDSEAQVDQQTNITVEDAAELLFDAADDAAIYDASYISGNRTLARWWSDGPRLPALRDLEQTEGGFLWERKDGFVALDASDRRQGASSRVSQATFADGQPASGEIPAVINGIIPDHPYEDLANIITSVIRPYSPPRGQPAGALERYRLRHPCRRYYHRHPLSQ